MSIASRSAFQSAFKSAFRDAFGDAGGAALPPLIRHTFTRANVTFKHGEQLGPVGSGCTNLYLQNRALTTAPNTLGTSCTATANATGYDGTANAAWDLDDSNAGGAGYVGQTFTGLSAPVYWAEWLIEKDTDETRFAAIRLSASSVATRTTTIHINTKTGAILKESSVDDGAVVADTGNGWWRFSVPVDNSSGNANLDARFYPARGTTIGTYDPAATGAVNCDYLAVYAQTDLPVMPIMETGATSSERYETTDADALGIITALKPGDGVVEILSNQCRTTGQTGTGYFTQINSSPFIPVAGTICKTKATAGWTADTLQVISVLDSPRLHDASGAGNYLCRMASTSNAPHVGSNSNASGQSADFDINGVVWLNANEYHMAFILGGYDASGQPDPAGTYGWHFFRKDITGAGSWELVCSMSTGTDMAAAAKYLAATNWWAARTLDLDDFYVSPEGSPTELFTPTGYALETSVTGSTTWTHPADGFSEFEITTLPSSGNIDIVIRTDWAIRISSAGAVTLLEDYDGAQTVRGTSAQTLTAGQKISLHMTGTEITLWLNASNGGRTHYASATANQADTGGAIGSLGTGGAVGHIYARPQTSGDYPTPLDAF
jgi:hypothetical protein